MLQRAMGAFALLGGALLAGSFLAQANVGPEERPPATTQTQVPVAVSIPTPAPAPTLTPAASSVPGATEPARVQAPQAKDQSEAKILAVLDELDHYREGTMNVPREDGRMLRLLAEAIGAKNVVEIGTSNGYSGLWLSLALRTTRGHLTTFEIDRGRFEMARANFKKAGVNDGVTQVFGNAHQEVSQLQDPIDLLFIDADKQGYLDYLTKLLPLVRPGGLILAHNMASPPPDPAFVKAITTNPELETLFVNMDASGLGITLKKR
jgi:predicted O-methyltransferase YrrM